MILNYFIEDEEIRFGKFLASTWKVYSKNFFAITILTMLPMIFAALLASIIPGGLAGFWPVVAVFYLLYAVALVFSASAIMIYTEEAVAGGTPLMSTAVDKAFSRLPAAVTTGLMTLVFLIGWYLLLIVPGIIKSVRYSYALQAVALRDASNLEAVRYSEKTVKDYWWIVLFSGIALAVPGYVIVLAVAAATGLSVHDVQQMQLASLINFLGVGFWVVGDTLMFLAMERMKKAGEAAQTPGGTPAPDTGALAPPPLPAER